MPDYPILLSIVHDREIVNTHIAILPQGVIVL